MEVVSNNGDMQVCALAAGGNISLLEEQIRKFGPRLVAVWTEDKAKELKEKIKDLDVKVVSGMDGLLEVAAVPGERYFSDSHRGYDRDFAYDRSNQSREKYCAGK